MGGDLETYYSITISNSTSGIQSYALYNQAPIVRPPADDISTHAILVARNIAATTGSATFAFPRDDFYAICGTLHRDEAVRVRALDKRPVQLGSTSSEVSKKGTTASVNMTSGALAFDLWAGTSGDKGESGAFCIKTGNFSYNEAKNNQHIVAMGLRTSTSFQVGVYASFVPVPNTAYQIVPSTVYYVVPSDLRVNEPKTDDVDFNLGIKIDFADHPPHIHLDHGNDGKLVVYDEVTALRTKLW